MVVDLAFLCMLASVDSSGVEWSMACVQGPLFCFVPHPQAILAHDAWIVLWCFGCGILFWGPIAYAVGAAIDRHRQGPVSPHDGAR